MFKVAGLILVWLAVSLSLGLVVVSFIPNKSWRLVVVASGSMEPQIKVGDLAVVIKNQSPQPGDIVLFKHKSQLVLHRLVRQEAGYWLTKGDANLGVDKTKLKTGQIIGKTVFIIPAVGLIFYHKGLLFMSTYIVFGLVLAAGLGLVHEEA